LSYSQRRLFAKSIFNLNPKSKEYLNKPEIANLQHGYLSYQVQESLNKLNNEINHHSLGDIARHVMSKVPTQGDG
jgi:hypothetical protein